PPGSVREGGRADRAHRSPGAGRALLLKVVDHCPLEFRLLGPLAVSGPTGPITVRGPRQRALLIRLLIEANQPVPVGRRAHALWGGVGRGRDHPARRTPGPCLGTMV